MIVPPEKIKSFLYHCDSKFHVGDLPSLFEEKEEKHGVIIISGSEGAVYSLNSHLSYQTHISLKNRIPCKHRRGGQSANRIARLHDELVHNYLTIIIGYMDRFFKTDGVSNIKSLIISGPGPKKEELSKRLSLDIPVRFYNEEGIDDLIYKKGKELLGEDTGEEEIQVIRELLRTDPDRLVFGDEIKYEYESNRLEKLWCITKPSYLTEKKTSIVIVNNPFLADYMGVIGLRWR